ncbi:hypothetical protein AAFF_G00004040 [Aldrovandia affinis]|uniref:Cystatin fetuin-A-type domain-containing protein n=1 Tax=Aldrovandia affinis TaxID=143900 RepID=A0AAD7X3L8_9TELE|nr:hypothetical protein AAFF_G00004040 [Aldrovandia affinis]
MRPVAAVVVLGVLAGALARPPAFAFPPSARPMCDSPEVEEAAVVAVDYINAQHSRGYKYALNRIDDVKATPLISGGKLYILELDLLQTKCHTLDPTPAANCIVRPKHERTFEGDCDAAVENVNGTLSVKAFKCKSKAESVEDMCVGCPLLLPLNHTGGLSVVDTSLATFNLQSNDTAVFAMLEVGRLTSQIVSGGPRFAVEYVIVETNCSSNASEGCTPLSKHGARHGICGASASPKGDVTVDCKIFPSLVPIVDVATNGTATPVAPPHPATGLLSLESQESAEVPVVKREAPPEPTEHQGPPDSVMVPVIQRAMRGLIVLTMLVGALSAASLHPPDTHAITCDDQGTTAAAQTAQHYINIHHYHGYKFRLSKIKSSKVVEQENSTCEFHLELELEETKCHIVNPKPFDQCESREMGEVKVQADCFVNLTVAEGKAKLKKYSCTSGPVSLEELRATCPDCPSMIPLHDPQGQESIKQAMKNFHQHSNHSAFFKLMEVGRLSTQHTFMGQSYFAEFAIVETNCARTVEPENENTCEPLCNDKAHHGFCESTMLGNDEVSVECEIFDVQNTTAKGSQHNHHYHRTSHGRHCAHHPGDHPGAHTRPAPPPHGPPRTGHPPMFPHPPSHPQQVLVHAPPFHHCPGSLKIPPSIHPICPHPFFDALLLPPPLRPLRPQGPATLQLPDPVA